MTTQQNIQSAAVADTWFELISSLYDLRLIKTKQAYKQALAALRQVMRVRRRNRDQNDYLKTLSAVIGEYESKTCKPVESSDPLDNLRFLLDENEMSASDLGRLLGDRSLGTRILSGQRDLSKTHIRKLSERFRVSTDLFMG
ncbi:type II toxin-antitoxin system HigA family antitoxin [Planctomycetota bacterium]